MTHYKKTWEQAVKLYRQTSLLHDTNEMTVSCSVVLGL